MNGLASLLDEPTSSRVQLLWHGLETQCGLVGVKATPFPHISWQVTEAYDLPALERALGQFASQSKPFLIHGTGLGLFTGENPILYIAILKDETLMHFHELLWKQMRGIAIQPSHYYSPTQWVPHITLAINDLDRHTLDCAMQFLTFQNYDWKVRIDNLVFVTQTDNQAPAKIVYQFTGGS
jgi:2'-5' RNA ligase